MKVLMGYPTRDEEVEVVLRMGVNPPRGDQVLTPAEMLELQAAADRVYVDHGVVDYAVNVVLATRTPSQYGLGDLTELIAYGASPRASLGLVAAGRALALMRGRSYALPQDVFDCAPDVLRHRIVLSYEALAQNLTTDHLLARILGTVPAPRIAPSVQPATPATVFEAVTPAAAATYGPPAVEPTQPPPPS
jgi:MoxR-like ATPase